MTTSRLLAVTDGSLNATTGVAGYAWATPAGSWGAACTWPPSDNITVAESEALATVVETAPGDVPLHIVTDSQASLEQLRMAAAGITRRDSRPARAADRVVTAARARTAETVLHWFRGHTQTAGVTVLHRQMDLAARKAARRVSGDPNWYDRTDAHIQTSITTALAGHPDAACRCGWAAPVTSVGAPYPSDPATWTLHLDPAEAS